MTVAPLITGQRVIVGTAPGGTTSYEYAPGAAGTVYCLNLFNGETLWDWDTTTENLWGNPGVNSGGGIWYPPSVDDDGVLYFGTGNAGPFPGTDHFPNGSSRPGPNDYANSLIALDGQSGHLIWFRNLKPHDLFDHDNQLSPVLAECRVGGVQLRLALTAGKHGYVAAFDRASGEEVWRTAVGRHENDHLEKLPQTFVRVFPGLFGGALAPMAYTDDLLLVAVLNLSTEYSSVEYNFGSILLDDARSELVALDAGTGRVVWSVSIPTGVVGAGPTVANDVAFVGGLDGVIRGYRISDGLAVWSFQAGAGLNAPFAVAGNELFVPAGAFHVPSSDPESLAWEDDHTPALLAFRLEN